MRVAVLGAGRMGVVRATALAADPRVDEVVISNRSPDRAVALAEQLQGPGRPLGDRPQVRAAPWEERDSLDQDATVVTLATSGHDEVLRRVLTRGRPVLCEKPIAPGLAETVELIELAAGHGTVLQVGFQRRFDSGLRELQERIHDGRLGTVYALRLISHDHEPAPREFIEHSGGVFRDLHVHDLDLVRWLTGEEVETVYATGAVRLHQEYADFDDADVSLIHAVTTSGIQVSIHGARHDPLGLDVRVEAFGSLDSATAGLNARTPLHLVDGSLAAGADGSAAAAYSGFVDRFREAFDAETAAFVDLVAGLRDNPCPPGEALESLRAALACQRSADTGTVVRVADVDLTP
jgi:myo-inositol 2-dehydrogenase/D-chiro-inositol 1-dehydrogenase